MKTGIVIFAHGSSVASANDAVRAVAEQVASLGGLDLVEAAFLEQGSPDLAGAVARLAARPLHALDVSPG